MLWVSGVIVSIGIGCAFWKDRMARADQSAEAPDADHEDEKTPDLAALMQNDLAALSNGVSMNDADPSASSADAKTDRQSAPQPECVSLGVMPYDPRNEGLVVVWDDRRKRRPKVTVLPDARNPRIAEVSLDNKLVARVASDTKIVSRMLCVMPRSRAARFGWATQ